MPMHIPNLAPNDNRPFDLPPTRSHRFPESLDLRPDRQCRCPHSECAHAIFCSPCFRTFLRAINRLGALDQALRLATERVRVGSQNGAMVVLWRDGPRFIACVQGSDRVRREAGMQAVVTHQRMVRARSTCCSGRGHGCAAAVPHTGSGRRDLCS